MMVPAEAALADEYSETVELFRNAGESAALFTNSYGYAVFPTIGKAGLVVGGAHGTGRVYAHGKYVGDTSMTQVSVGIQAGGQAYSQIILFQDKRAFDEFTSGDFEFDANVGAVAITAAATGTDGTTGVSVRSSGAKRDALPAVTHYKEMAVFTMVNCCPMYEISVAGQKFSYKPRK